MKHEDSSDVRRTPDVQAKFDELLKRLGKLDPGTEIRIKLTSPAPRVREDHFSDWHDSFKDGPQWSKTFGKA